MEPDIGEIGCHFEGSGLSGEIEETKSDSMAGQQIVDLLPPPTGIAKLEGATQGARKKGKKFGEQRGIHGKARGKLKKNGPEFFVQDFHRPQQSNERHARVP